MDLSFHPGATRTTSDPTPEDMNARGGGGNGFLDRMGEERERK